MRDGECGDKLGEKSYKSFLLHGYFYALSTHSIVIPAEAGIQYSPALGHIP